MKIKTVVRYALATAFAAFAGTSAQATSFTTTSPTVEGALPAGATEIGGLVLDAVGLNGARLVAQLSASSLYEGFANSNPLTIGTQTGLTAALLAQLGGGFSELAVRVTLFDGDNAAGNFDANNNTLFLNGLNVGNWTTVNAQNTDGVGAAAAGGFSGGGFRNNLLDTGWFHVTNAGLLSSIFTSVSGSNELVYGLNDSDPQDNFFDFKQGVDGGLINIEQAPVITPPSVPEGGSTVMLLSLSMLGLGMLQRRFAH